MSEPVRCCLVVPCYNEASRLDRQAFLSALDRDAGVGFVFVNDGSRDATLERLHQLRDDKPDRVWVVDQQPNQGKAAAVRAGILYALALGPQYVGYWDADLATPLAELPRFEAVLRERPEVLVVFGARVQLLGRSIQRSSVRHYLGRIFATAASVVLGLPVYDTQCGAKLFVANAETEALFFEPFVVNWTFDVELVARFVRGRDQTQLPSAASSIFELPLDRWHDVAGSKVRPRDFLSALAEMLRIHSTYLSARARREFVLARSANRSEPHALLKSPTRADTGSVPTDGETPR